MKVLQFLTTSFFILLLPFSCTQDSETSSSISPQVQPVTTGTPRFQLLSPEKSGIQFSNEINEDYDFNILNYEYLYNGGGVSIGDINNDNLPDIYFSATFATNRLYLNKGNMQFEDITSKAGVAANRGFKTGVTMADVNNDGWLDIMVCKTSNADDGQKNNQLFINNKDLTFTESAAKYGLDDNSNTNHANFFDYDGDGDLDLYLLNHRLGFKDAVRLRLTQNTDGSLVRQTNPQTAFESDRLYRNDGNGSFSNVSQQAGINNSAFGLSASVADLNQDGHLDIFVANDYIEPDYVYINNGDGTFTDQYTDYIRHGSQNSMGSDLADFNNDGLLDMIVLDMVAEDPVRYKQLMNVMQLERYETLVRYGYGHQVGRNVLQVNNGNGTFSEIGQLAGVSHTDWSWGAFFADFDNDGFKDIYIGNGYKRDVTNLDYMTYTRDSVERSGGITKRRYPDINTFLNVIPSTKTQNYMFRNQGDLTFENVSNAWGMPEKTFSNGTAYGDLDGDGDLDLVVNNIGDPAFIYENTTSGRPDQHFLQIKCKGAAKNTSGLGTKVTLRFADGTLQHQELSSNRGFFSSSQLMMHFGLGANTVVNRVEVLWPDGKTQVLEEVKADQILSIDYANAKKAKLPAPTKATPLFQVAQANLGIAYQHKENEFQDFNQERLIPHKLSQLGPRIAVGDINGDQREDFFIGGSHGSPGAIYTQTANSTFQALNTPALQADLACEDLDAVFFDADGDGDQDLYVVSGGKIKAANDPVYQDRLYINDGKGNLTKSTQLPQIRASGACVSAHDYDGDGDQDILVGGRVTPGSYPTTPISYLLVNEKGVFKDKTAQLAPDFRQLGMITDLQWADVDGETGEELIVTGEWIPLSIFKVKGQKLQNITTTLGLQNSNGWWNCVQAGDFDKDGDMDIIAGNLGHNTRLKASDQNPLAIFAKDFDQNSAVDAVFAFSKDGKFYPFAGRDALVKQVPKVKKKFPNYATYAKATVQEIFSASELKDAQQLMAKTLASSYFENQGKGQFVRKDLPSEAQIAPAKNLLVKDINKDGHLDVLFVGNDSGADTETGVYDASNGVCLLGDGKGGFAASPNRDHGFWASKEARDVVTIKLVNGKELVLVANNNAPVQAFLKLD